MNPGKTFEKRFYKALENNNVYWYHFPDSAGYDSSDVIRFTATNPYDCFFILNDRFYAVELKSTNKNYLSIGINRSIRPHQIAGLYKVFSRGHIAGFLFEFRQDNKVWFVKIEDFINQLDISKKKSISKYEIEEIGLLVSWDIKSFKNIVQVLIFP